MPQLSVAAVDAAASAFGLYPWYIQQPDYGGRYFVNLTRFAWESIWLLYASFTLSLSLSLLASRSHFLSHERTSFSAHTDFLVAAGRISKISNEIHREYYRQRVNVFRRNELTFNNTFWNFITVSLLLSISLCVTLVLHQMATATLTMLFWFWFWFTTKTTQRIHNWIWVWFDIRRRVKSYDSIKNDLK